MVPPDDIFGVIPTWIAVYVLATAAFGVAGFVLYRRVFRLILLGKDPERFDQPVRRFFGALPYVFGQRKVLQSVSLRDRAGIAHFIIFWGFLSFTTSYVLYIFGDSAWREFSETILTGTGVRIFTAYLDVLALVFFVVLTWAAVRRWSAKPRRLSYDLTQKIESAVILMLIACLMLFTLLTEAFYVAGGGGGPHADALIGRPIGEAFASAGIDGDLANGLQALFWWLHLGIILGFSIYIPLSKHMHLVAAPISFYTRKLEPRGTLPTPTDLETAEVFGASRIQDFTWKELLDGYSCAVCGRCSDVCPANITGKVLSPMHIVENMKEHVLEHGPGVVGGEDEQESKPLIGNWVSEEALWDCVTCGACIQECPVGVEHIDSIVDMRRFMVMEQASMPDTAMNALLSMEQRGHPWRGTTYARTDWADGLDVPTLAQRPDAEILFWVGCTAALEQRSQNVARSMASVLKRAGVDFAILGDEETLHRRPRPSDGQRVPVPDTRPAEYPDHEHLQRQEGRHHLPALLQHNQERVPTPRRRLRCRPLHRVRQRPDPRRTHPPRRPDRHDHRIPRLLLPRATQRHLRRPQGDRQLYPRRQAGRDGALSRARLLLRSWRRTHVDRRVEGPADQSRPHPTVPGNRREDCRSLLPVLPPNVRGGHRLRRKREQRAGQRPARSSGRKPLRTVGLPWEPLARGRP